MEAGPIHKWWECARPHPQFKGRLDRQSALSQHLARLRRANIVRTRRESQTNYYSIEDSDMLRILRLLGHFYTDDPVMQRTRH